MLVRVMAALCAMGLMGCYSWRNDVMRTASIQHSCPLANIQILTDDDRPGAPERTVALRVCRERRIYQRAGNDLWVDQTPTPTVVVVNAPAVAPSASSPSASAPEAREGIFARLVRTRIDTARPQVLACTGGPTAVVAEWATGNVRITVRNETDGDVARCVSNAIGTIEVPAGTLPGRLIHPVAP